jgi:hypothetical protein
VIPTIAFAPPASASSTALSKPDAGTASREVDRVAELGQ